MAISVGDILQITDVQTFLAQTLLNVYTYRVVSLEAAADYADVAEAFDNGVVQPMAEIQNSGLIHTRYIVKNLTNGLDLFEDPRAVAGAGASTPETSFTALGFRLIRSTTLTRHGSKRVGGLSEVSTQGNDLTPSYVTQVNALAAAFAANIARSGTVDHDIDLEPVIVGRFPIGHADAGEYDLSKINPVASCQFIRTTTQTTRRAGRGT